MSNGSNSTASSAPGANTQSGNGPAGQTPGGGAGGGGAGGAGGPFGAGPFGGGPFGGGPFGGPFSGGPFGGGNMFADPMQMMMLMAALQGARQNSPQQVANPAACFSSMMPMAWTGFPWAWMIWWSWLWSWFVWPGFLPGGGGFPATPGGVPNLMGQFAVTRADFWFHIFEAIRSIWQQAANATGLAGFPFVPDPRQTERTDPAKLREALKDFPDEQRERIVWAVQCSEMMMSMFQPPRR